jgi:hypothetical protein
MRWMRCCAALVLLFVLAPEAPAKSWQAVSLPDFLAVEGPVFVGRLSKVEQAKVLDHPVYLATIEVAETLRGNLPRAVQISWPDLGPGRGFAGMTYKVGDEGVWIVRGQYQLIGDESNASRHDRARKEHPDLYDAGHPMCLQPLEKKGEVEQVLARQGLRLRLDVSDFNTPEPGGGRTRSVRLALHNPGRVELKLHHMDNRQALSFIVLDELGNVVTPLARGKADPAAEADFALGPGQTVFHYRKDLDYVSGTGQFGYELEAGKTYRVTALYRPEGAKGSAVASAEVMLKVH